MTNAIHQQHYQTLITSHSTREAQRAAERRCTQQASYPEHLTTAQRDWLIRFQAQTHIEPLHLADLQAGRLSFDYVARVNIRHFEIWFRSTMNTLTRDLPTDQDNTPAPLAWLDR